jgi:hypothetical protein
MAKTKHQRDSTTVPPLPEGTDFKDALRAFLKTGAPPKNLGRPKTKKQKAAKKR